jgi:hypothetical protein
MTRAVNSDISLSSDQPLIFSAQGFVIDSANSLTEVVIELLYQSEEFKQISVLSTGVIS